MLHVQLLVVDRENSTRLCGVGEQGGLYIRAAAKVYSPWSPDRISMSRLEVVVGDTAKPLLDLLENTWDHLHSRLIWLSIMAPR
jgi:hypothetical protein